MLKVDFRPYRQIADFKVKYSVIVARYQDSFVFVKHRERSTWEIPGGHVEPGESPFEAAERELMEETSANLFSVIPISLYSVTRDGITTYGALFFADISSFLGELQFETSELILAPILPECLTYPEIQPILFDFVKRFLEGNSDN